MSMYGDDEKGREKEDLFYTVKDFIDEHTLSELFEVIADVLRSTECCFK